MTIQEKIYIRFLTSLARLKGEEKVTDKILIETAKKYLETEITTSTNFAIKLMKDELLVKTALVTGLMEASNDWNEFEKLHKKQQEEAKDNTPTDQPLDLTEFNKVLKQLLNAPPPKKKKN